MMTPEELASQDADRADWLERVARLIYESETMGEDLSGDFGPQLRQWILEPFERRWGIKVEEPYCQYWHEGMRSNG